jgi:dipeptidyl aminopeptidase/acylaminoacyl peptidase
MPIYRPYGTWESPITARAMTEASVGVTPAGACRGRLCWLEARSTEKGRVVLVAEGEGGGTPVELTPAEHSLRSRVHEYGGGAVACAGDQLVYVNFADQRLYRIGGDGRPVPLTAPSGEGDPALRFADMAFDPTGGRIACVREDHRGGGEPANTVVLVDLDGATPEGRVVADGHDFFAAPRFSPDGRWLCYLSWDHPNMPWDGTDLWRAPVTADGVGAPEHVAGGPSESIFQPEWSPDGVLHFVSDRTGWWNLYRLGPAGAEPVFPIEADCGLPLWQFGMRSYAFLPDGTPIVAVIEQGISRLYRVKDGHGERIDVGWDVVGSPFVTPAGVMLACGSFTRPSAVVAVDARALAAPATAAQGRVLRASAQLDLDPGLVSTAKPVSWPTGDGAEAHGFHYPPANPRFSGTPGTLPPLIVRSHGGPTGAVSPEFSLAIQYWTSRGFAVLDVNYRGSTGYGRAYRDALKAQWGVADVEDCASGARFLAAQGLVDPDRLVIRGGSAGGYTTLCALAFTDSFRAGASHYGIGDLRALARDTHKFESRYLDALVGPLPEAEAVYEARSPLLHAGRITCPVIFLQGLEDKVVPPNQAEAMVAALRANGVPVAYLAFPGEQHGFRQAPNIIRALEAELWFYGRVFGFAPADPIEPVPIEGLP